MSKKISMLFVILTFVVLTFGEVTTEFKFYFVFGDKIDSGIKANINYQYSSEEWAFLSIKSNFYPVTIKINDQKLILRSDKQTIVVRPGKIKITYNNNSFFYQAKRGDNAISLVKNIQLKPNITYIEFRDEVSPNDDWDRDKMKLVINSNTYAKLRLDVGNESFEKEIFPGDNQLYFDFKNIDDGIYKAYVKIYNEKGSVEKEKNILIDRTQKSYGKEILFGFIAFFAGLIIWDSLWYLCYYIIKNS